MTDQTQNLSDLSAVTRRQMATPKVHGDGLRAIYRNREQRQILNLGFTAANLAAAERKRHGRPAEIEEKADAAQDAIAAVYSAAAPDLPKLADLIDQDRERVATFDGSRESLRPCREMITAAGASLDRAHSARTLLDPAAGSGDLLAAAAQTRDAAEQRRRKSVAAQLADPTVSPLPVHVSEAIGAAGIWPTDALRQSILDTAFPDLTADDWHLVGEGTTKAIERRRAKANGLLSADPKARIFGTLLQTELEPTDAERAELEADLAQSMVCANPDGPTPTAAKLIDQAWRTNQPYSTPLYVNGELVPAAEKTSTGGEG